MEHLISNLIVAELNLTCLSESNQHQKKDIKYYMTC
jgi:hypothetical protein